MFNPSVGGTRLERERQGEREVFGERGIHHMTAARARKPTEVGGGNRWGKLNETIVKTGWFQIIAYPRCGEGCGDTQNPYQAAGFSSKNVRTLVKRHRHLHFRDQQ